MPKIGQLRAETKSKSPSLRLVALPKPDSHLHFVWLLRNNKGGSTSGLLHGEMTLNTLKELSEQLGLPYLVQRSGE